MSALTNYAKSEFIRAGWCDENLNFNDDMQKAICDNLLELLGVLSNQHHSGFSHGYLMGLFKLLADFKPITPINGDESEWSEPYSDDGARQNIIISSVFMENDGSVYDIDAAYMWEWVRDEDGEVYKSTFSSSESRQPVEFPYLPPKEPKAIFRPTSEFPNEVLDDTP